MKIKQVDYFGFDHEKVNKMFEGGLTFCNYFGVKGVPSWVTVAVYKVAKPNREKGHKDYLLLTDKYVSGMNADQIEKFRYQEGIACLECGTALYSINTHHYHTCGCPNNTMIDGGRDYVRCGAKDFNKTETVTIDLIENTIVKTQKRPT